LSYIFVLKRIKTMIEMFAILMFSFNNKCIDTPLSSYYSL